MNLSEQELVKLLDDLYEKGRAAATAESDFKNAEREVKVVRGLAINAALAQDPKMSVTKASALVDGNNLYVEKVRALNDLYTRHMLAAANNEHAKARYEAWRTYSANTRAGV